MKHEPLKKCKICGLHKVDILFPENFISKNDEGICFQCCEMVLRMIYDWFEDVM